MKPSFQRIAGLNLSIVLATAVVLRLVSPAGPAAMNMFSAYMTGAIFLHSLVLLVLALTNSPPETRSSYWLSLLLVLLVGVGACRAGASISLP